MLLSMIGAKTDQILQNISFATGKNKSVVMRMVDSLERKGLVRRVVNPEDRRENFLAITPEGESVVAQYHEIENRLSSELLQGLPQDKVEAFFEVAEAVSKRAGQF